MTYAFHFDSTFCSGCKACQAACKDKNQLPTGVLWRRVIEVNGGTWQKKDDAWSNSVFAYNLSISCNHCVHPKCAGVCPVNAYVLREDGIVLLDTTKCVGCGYCAWACPYGVPQYNASAGHMTKCDFCVDHLEQGMPPACVAACPMRVLDYGDATSTGQEMALWQTPPEAHPYPLPVHSHTQPRLAIRMHPAISTIENKNVGNIEELQPLPPSQWDEMPLLVFTLLTQLAVGGFWAMSWNFPLLWSLVESDAIWLRLLPAAVIGLSLGIGMLASFAHLGTKKNAWRVLSNVRRSSLSREILFTGLFGAGWLLTVLAGTFVPQHVFDVTAITVILGIGLVYNMSQVYRLPAVPAWNTWRTNAAFMVSALLLGQAVMAALLAYQSNLMAIQLPSSHWIMIESMVLILLVVQLSLWGKQVSMNPLAGVRMGLALAAIALTASNLLNPDPTDISIRVATLLIVLMAEALGRWLFYRSRPQALFIIGR